MSPSANSAARQLSSDARFAELLGLVPSREDEAEPPVRDRVEKSKNNAQ